MANETGPQPTPPSVQSPAINPATGAVATPPEAQVRYAALGVPQVQKNFWQHPWVQHVLPFATSVTLHLTILLIGVVFFLGAKYVQKKIVHQEEVIIPAAAMINEGAPGGVPFQGLGNDPNRQAMQDKLKDGGTPEGWSDKRGTKLSLQAASGGGEGDTNDNIIGVGPGGGFGSGKHGKGSGVGEALGSGEGDGSGPLAMFGTPGGGALGLKGPIFGSSGNAKKIAFVCDASGSMLSKFSTLRRELSKSVRQLKPIQSFSLIFFQQQSYMAMEQDLRMASPEAKRRADNFLETVVPRAETNPIPALELAFKQKPDLIYLLTDGDFPDNNAVKSRIRELDKDKRVKINTIAFVGDKDNDTDFMKLLKEIAEETGGVYRFVRESDL
jgi:hypothetical protein